MKSEKRGEVVKREDKFVQRPSTKICHEESSIENPFISISQRCYGYDHLELMKNRSYVDVIYLLFRGDLPTEVQSDLFEKLMIGLINPGPRHPATRAAMNAGVGKTESVHILPIALSVLGGDHLGAGEIEGAMRFLRKYSKKDPSLVLKDIQESTSSPSEGDWHIAPGFGSRFGGIDRFVTTMAEFLCSTPGAGKALSWGRSFAKELTPLRMGWLSTGLVAATLCDLGFAPRDGAGVYQLICAPGLLAHGLELTNKPLTAMPFPSDDNYIIEE